MPQKHKLTFSLNEHSQVFWEQLEARGISLDGQAYVEGRIYFPTIFTQTVPRLCSTPGQDIQEKNLYQRLSQLLFDQRLVLTGDDSLAHESALNILQALVHEELQKVRARIALMEPQSTGDIP